MNPRLIYTAKKNRQNREVYLKNRENRLKLYEKPVKQGFFFSKSE